LFAGAQYYVYLKYACSGYTLSSSNCTSITQQWNDLTWAYYGALSPSNVTCASSSGQITVTLPVVYSAYASYVMGRLNPVSLPYVNRQQMLEYYIL
jgi:hypothetical protein